MSAPAGKAERLFLIIFDLVAGGLKLAAILAPLWLPFLLIFGDSNCRGDCGVGMGMLFIGLLGIAAMFGPVLLLIGLPLVILLLGLWTRGRPVQLIGGIAVIPMLIVSTWGYYTIRNTIKDSQIQASLRPEYLGRTVGKPVGKLEHLVGLGSGGFSCSSDCYEVLVNGLAAKYSEGYLDTNQGNGIFERVYALSTGPECLSSEASIVESIKELQSRGIFGSCILETTPNTSLTATLLRGLNSDRGVRRPYGLPGFNVLQPIKGSVLGPELIRWEVGRLPGSREVIGTPFTWQDLVRAYTGISKDRFAEAAKLDHSQRIAVILSASNVLPLQLRPVFSYLQSAPDASRFWTAPPGGVPQKLSDDDFDKLKKIGTRICAATPVIKDFGDQTKACVAIYNENVQRYYSGNASDLVLRAQ